MLFLINSRICPGATRDRVIAHLKKNIEKEEWELVKKGIITHWFFKVGDQPGFVALLNCDSLEEVHALLGKTPVVREGLLEFDVDPVNHFPHFD
jgi:muconolactone delta-isomerase